MKILMVFFVVATGAVTALSLATFGALGLVVLGVLLLFGVALPRPWFAAWWLRMTTVDPRDPHGRTPLHRAADDFAKGWRAG